MNFVDERNLQDIVLADMLKIVYYIKANKNHFSFNESDIKDLFKNICRAIKFGPQCNEPLIRVCVDDTEYCFSIASAYWSESSSKASYGWGDILCGALDPDERAFWHENKLKTGKEHALFVLLITSRKKNDDSAYYYPTCCFGDKATHKEITLDYVLENLLPKDERIYKYNYIVTSDDRDFPIDVKIMENNLHDMIRRLDQKYMRYEMRKITKVKSEGNQPMYSFIARDNNVHLMYITREIVDRQCHFDNNG